MHSALVRLQNVFGFFTTVSFCLAGIIALTALVSPQTPTANIQLRNIQVVKGRPHYYSSKKEEYAHIKFDLEADFSSLFNWNTKQLFVYILATYPSLEEPTTSPPSQAIIWDLLIPSASQLNARSPWSFFQTSANTPARLIALSSNPNANKKAPAKAPEGWKGDTPGILKIKNVKPKYQITDISGRLAERGNVTLEVGWNIQPWVGALTWTMPEESSLGRWVGVKGGRSKAFDMPPLKGKKSETIVETIRQSPKAAEATPAVG
ncbi:MAG: hypothetical protein MMC33_002972 [Icmadophila ericetorum]|nr:hypothetical protein [Icmadophila ericetorum]